MLSTAYITFHQKVCEILLPYIKDIKAESVPLEVSMLNPCNASFLRILEIIQDEINILPPPDIQTPEQKEKLKKAKIEINVLLKAIHDFLRDEQFFGYLKLAFERTRRTEEFLDILKEMHDKSFYFKITTSQGKAENMEGVEFIIETFNPMLTELTLAYFNSPLETSQIRFKNIKELLDKKAQDLSNNNNSVENLSTTPQTIPPSRKRKLNADEPSTEILSYSKIPWEHAKIPEVLPDLTPERRRAVSDSKPQKYQANCSDAEKKTSSTPSQQKAPFQFFLISSALPQMYKNLYSTKAINVFKFPEEWAILCQSTTRSGRKYREEQLGRINAGMFASHALNIDLKNGDVELLELQDVTLQIKTTFHLLLCKAIIDKKVTTETGAKQFLTDVKNTHLCFQNHRQETHILDQMIQAVIEEHIQNDWIEPNPKLNATANQSLYFQPNPTENKPPAPKPNSTENQPSDPKTEATTNQPSTTPSLTTTAFPKIW